MTKRYPAGSEWRKWDLHVHVPGTKLNDAYDKNDGKHDFDRFAEVLENSDVAVTSRWSTFTSFFETQFPT